MFRKWIWRRKRRGFTREPFGDGTKATPHAAEDVARCFRRGPAFPLLWWLLVVMASARARKSPQGSRRAG